MKRDKNNFEYAKWLGLYYLSFRMHTRAELLDKLRKKDVSPPFCEQALQYFEDEGYIDDFDYAVRFIKDGNNLNGRGPSRIRAQLQEKRIDSATISRAFACANVDFDSELTRVLEKKADTLDLSDKKDRDRLIRYLLQKGFKYADIFDKLRGHCNS
ncbi:MAG: regulatory protein RecX [Clostridiales bacterium]|jgi:regulatory protein|nr:regulatory protein RecX [Clostridiales bacterium]